MCRAQESFASSGAHRRRWELPPEVRRRELRARLLDFLEERVEAGDLTAEARAALKAIRDQVARQGLEGVARSSRERSCASCGEPIASNPDTGRLYCSRSCAGRAAYRRAREVKST